MTRAECIENMAEGFYDGGESEITWAQFRMRTDDWWYRNHMLWTRAYHDNTCRRCDCRATAVTS